MDRNSLIQLYFYKGLNYKEICLLLSLRHGYDISLRHLKRILKSYGLCRRKHWSNIDDLAAFVEAQTVAFESLHGYRWMHLHALQSGYTVSREIIRQLQHIVDEAGVENRRRRRLKRRVYIAKGPNFIWHLDSYDKLKPYGLCINGCIDGFSRYVVWLKAYITSSDPTVIGRYFVDTIEQLQLTPRLVRSDLGTENVTVAAIQQFLRRDGADSRAGERSYLSGTSQNNQRIEQWWSTLRKQCSEVYIQTLHSLKENGDFTGSDFDKELIRFCFLRLLQV